MITKGWIKSTVSYLLTSVLGLTLLTVTDSGGVGIHSNPPTSSVLITALYYDTYVKGEPEEAFQIMNIGATDVDIGGWSVADNEGTVTFPIKVKALRAYQRSFLTPGQKVWVTKTAAVFQEEFGFQAGYEYGGNSDDTVPDMPRKGSLSFANRGDEVVLNDALGNPIDVLVYKKGSTDQKGWSGEAVEPYIIYRFPPEQGQILYRKLDEATGLPQPDTDTAADWAQDKDDSYYGKKVRYPGWNLDHFFQTQTATESARLTYLVAPDNIFDPVLEEIQKAQTSIYIQSYTFENPFLAEAIVERQQTAGVEVKMLLEGRPYDENAPQGRCSSSNGISDQERWVAQQIEHNGGEVCFTVDADNDRGICARYNFQHAKFIVIDEKILLTGSENLNIGSMPADDKSNGTAGNRGIYLITDAPTLVAHALDVFHRDLDLHYLRHENHDDYYDLVRWKEDDPDFGAPPKEFVPDYGLDPQSYSVKFPQVLEVEGEFPFEVVQCPENCLRVSDGLLGLIGSAGIGEGEEGDKDIVLVEQAYERTHWGPRGSNPEEDPNPRLEAYIEAARRGAKVRILLDSYYDDPDNPQSNGATVKYVNSIAEREKLALEARLGNPTGTGIHNKMVLVWHDGKGYVHTGSINGSENSSKYNRELAIQVQSSEAYHYLEQVFDYDWRSSLMSTKCPLNFQSGTHQKGRCGYKSQEGANEL